MPVIETKSKDPRPECWIEAELCGVHGDGVSLVLHLYRADDGGNQPRKKGILVRISFQGGADANPFFKKLEEKRKCKVGLTLEELSALVKPQANQSVEILPSRISIYYGESEG